MAANLNIPTDIFQGTFQSILAFYGQNEHLEFGLVKEREPVLPGVILTPIQYGHNACLHIVI